MTWVAKNVSRDPGLMMVHKVADIFEAKKQGKLGLVYQFQPTGALEGDIERAFVLKQAGLGTVQITYSKKGLFGCGCSEPIDEGLTPKGRDLIKVLNEAKIIVDVAHGGVSAPTPPSFPPRRVRPWRI